MSEGVREAENGAYGRTKREGSVMRDSSLIRVMNGISGDIVVGVKEGNRVGDSFYCSNNTFAECDQRQLDRSKDLNADYSNTNYTTQISSTPHRLILSLTAFSLLATLHPQPFQLMLVVPSVLQHPPAQSIVCVSPIAFSLSVLPIAMVVQSPACMPRRVS